MFLQTSASSIAVTCPSAPPRIIATQSSLGITQAPPSRFAYSSSILSTYTQVISDDPSSPIPLSLTLVQLLRCFLGTALTLANFVLLVRRIRGRNAVSGVQVVTTSL